MQVDAYHRTRMLAGADRQIRLIRFLGLVQSLLVILLLGLSGLFVSLIASRGETRFPSSRLNELPRWVIHRASGSDKQFHLYDDTGVFPLIAGSLLSDNPVHRIAGRGLDRLTNFLPSLRMNFGALATLLVLATFSILALTLTAWLRKRMNARAAVRLATTLRKQIHRQMYRLGQSSLPAEGLGPVINLWTREVNDVRDGFLADLDVIPRAPVLATGLLLTAVLVSPVLLAFSASLGVMAWLVVRIWLREHRLLAETALRQASVQISLLHEDLGLLRTVRVYGVEEFDRQRFDQHLEHHEEAEMRRLVTNAPGNLGVGLVFGLTCVVALGLLGFSIVINYQISIATMVMLIVALAGLAYPILEWLRLRNVLRQANRSARAFFEFLERRPELQQEVGAQFLNPIKDRITLENVALEGRSGRTLLSNISVEIPAGGRTVLLGSDEDSNLALACLIPRLIDPRTGRILIDGRDIRDVTLDSIRAQVATVFQADLVFTDSVTVNIGLGDAINTLPRVIEAAKIAHAHHFIQDLPHGYDTQIGPLGHYLKPDEQYRVALARAFLHDPSILIIEEPRTPMDEDTRHFLDDTLARLAVGRTLILIAHRLETIRSADLAIVLQDGHVEEVGPPRKLEHEGKLFRHLVYTEYNEFASGDIEAGRLELTDLVRKGR